MKIKLTETYLRSDIENILRSLTFLNTNGALDGKTFDFQQGFVLAITTVAIAFDVRLSNHDGDHWQQIIKKP